jgi:sarcosine oxidase subunit gamma
MAEPLVARSPFVDLAAVAAGPGVFVSDRDGIGLATVLVRKGQMDALAAPMRTHWGLDMPRGLRRTSANGVAFCGLGPEGWLATSNAGDGFLNTLRRALGNNASVVDQSGGYAVLRLTGPKVREMLAKGVPLDLHPHAFKVNDIAVTVVSHIGAILWRLEDGAHDAPAFEVAVFRSLAGSFWHWLAESSAEFGLTIA